MQKYETDVIAWANEQAAFIRAGRFDMLDLEHIADEIEDVGKAEKREFEKTMSILLAYLIKWQYQPSHRGASWKRTINAKRKGIGYHLKETPSLKLELEDPDFWSLSWNDGSRIAENETGMLNVFPESCPWSIELVMNSEFWPE